MWTPYEMEILLHHNGSMAPFPREGAPAYAPTVIRLVGEGLLESINDSPYRTTDLGKGLIELWKNTPLPIVKYVDPRLGEGA